MTDYSPKDNLIKMANQIAANLGYQGAEKIADHIRRFSSPAMREQLEILAKDAEQPLTAEAREAARLINH